ncbi:ATP-binding protein [Variovorax sp. LjRoot175]|uniref:AAA family ATPase n=1 Tax=Variovorax sp. LjRoot175 TaxID=3342276 RepID=UPI003ECDC9F1
MLIEFSVANFRSFRERQTLSMVAAPRLKKGDNVFVAALEGERIELLKAAVVYGPNASGKSNLLRALAVLSRLANRAPSAHSYPLPVDPFLFDRSLKDAPSVFEISFVGRDKVRYEFGLSATRSRVISEKLVYYPRGKEKLLYARTHVDEVDQYELGEALEGTPEIFSTWKKITSPQVLFLSQVVANSSEEFVQLRHPHFWLTKCLYSLLDGMEGLVRSTRNLVATGTGHEDDVAQFLQDVDVPVTKIAVETIEMSLLGADVIATGNSDEDLPLLEAKRQKRTRMLLTHTTDLGEGVLALEDESEGTKNLIGFWLPWTLRAIDHDNFKPRVMVVDELDSSLHPKIVESLVRMHLQSDVPSQLIFTTHDTHLMDAKLLRRDQFWVTERDANGATQLRSIHDFEGRASEDIEKRYYEGRYRGLPFVKN